MEKKENKGNRVIFHIDANSAYVSWTAADRLNRGAELDIRTVPAVIAGDPESRHGIVLAKSIPAKKCGIGTGDSLFEAHQRCEGLLVYPPDYDLYMACSQAMYEILLQYSPLVQRYSIDECFLDYTDSALRYGPPTEAARRIKDRIREELAFTVNVGVGPNKLLAKMAGELKKPDLVHTLWAGELEEKLWPLPVGELFMVGRATERKLRQVNIGTIGQLAQADPAHLRVMLKSHGDLIRRYANGIDAEPVICNADIKQKGLGNSATLKYDLTEERELHRTLLALCERVGLRLRRMNRTASLAGVSVKAGTFVHYSHQAELRYATSSTTELYRAVRGLFDQCWRKEPVRHLGVSVSGLADAEEQQISMFEREPEKERRVNEAVDLIRMKYGETAVVRGIFVNGEEAPLLGGVNDGSYITMGGFEQ